MLRAYCVACCVVEQQSREREREREREPSESGGSGTGEVTRTERIQQLRAQHQRRHMERRGQYPLDEREERYEEAIRQVRPVVVLVEGSARIECLPWGYWGANGLEHPSKNKFHKIKQESVKHSYSSCGKEFLA